MIINRNNYEEFFLLYVDGELSANDRKAVEDFAAENADLREELDILSKTVLPLDEMLFEDKGNLFRPVPIDSLLQEQLLFKVDNELAEDDTAALNALIATDENVQHEFALLKRTKLDPADDIIFADKHLLYRRERDNVVIGRFAKWAAAAVLIGFGLFIGVSRFNRTDSAERVADGIKVKPSSYPKAGTTSPAFVADAETITPDQKDDTISNTAVVPAQQHIAKTKTDDKLKSKSSTIITPDDKNIAQQNNVTVTPDNQTVSVPKPKTGNDISIKDRIFEEPKQQIAVNSLKQPDTGLDNSIIPLENTYSQAVALKEEKSGNRILYMDEDDIKRSKAGGFLRKVKRFVERTAKIKPGSSLKIAGFEFAAE